MSVFEVWAPNASDVRLHVDGAVHSMAAQQDGWWSSAVEQVPGMRYGYSLFDGQSWSMLVPDPRTTEQPDGVHGLSQVSDRSFDWTDQAWTGRVLPGQVIYELHVGTFTPEGTFAGVIGKLDYLKELGVTTIELMPVQPFGGNRNWGYDGVQWHAVHEGYGGRRGLKELVNAAHNAGLAVVMDCVFNHFGPEGSYNGMFGPYTQAGSTPWGDIVNLSGFGSDAVRAYIHDAVRMWFEEFHVDGIRLDAVQTLWDPGAIHLLEQLTYLKNEIEATTGIPRVLIAESDQNDPRLVSAQQAGGYGLDGQWIDDVHHALHTLVSRETHAYYADFGTTEVLATTIKNVFFHAETFSAFRGRTHGRRLDTTIVPASKFVTYTTTHDQVGNRARGDRPSMNLSPAQQVLKAAVIYSLPFTPMLFMGEEFGAKTPFAFFVDHSDPELLRMTREGRLNEFRRSGWSAEDVPDPGAESTYLASKLEWTFDPEQADILEAYQTLLRLRRELKLARPYLDHLDVEYGENWLWFGHEDVALVANFSAENVAVPVGGELIYSFTAPQVSAQETVLDAWGFALIRLG